MRLAVGTTTALGTDGDALPNPHPPRRGSFPAGGRFLDVPSPAGTGLSLVGTAVRQPKYPSPAGWDAGGPGAAPLRSV